MTAEYGATLCITAASSPPPDLVRHLDDQPQLRPLLLLSERVALLGRGEAALPGQAELIEGRVFRRRVDAALELVLAFELAGLCRHQTEHDLFALRPP